MPNKGIGASLTRYVVFFLLSLHGPSNASTAIDAYETSLHAALSTGALTQTDYDAKMKQHRQANAPMFVATRRKGETVIAVYDWLPAAGPFETKKLATDGARARL